MGPFAQPMDGQRPQSRKLHAPTVYTTCAQPTAAALRRTGHSRLFGSDRGQGTTGTPTGPSRTRTS